jgi:hypothetical protein
MQEPLAPLAECYRTIAKQALRARLHELARITAADPSVDAYRRSLANVCAMLDQAVALCTIELVERQGLIDAWIRTEAKFWLCRLPPEKRREKLLDPKPGPQRFIALRTRCEMLREIDDELRWGKPQARPAA